MSSLFCRVAASCLVLLSCALLVAAPRPAQAETIALVADEWCPYNCEPDSDAPGYMIEIAKAAFEPAGHTVKYVKLNWARAIEESRAGTHAGIVGASRTDAPDFVFPESSLGKDATGFYVRKEDPWTYTGLESIKGRRLGIIRGYSYGETLDAYFEKLGESDHVQIASGEDGLAINLKKILADRIDTVLENAVVFDYLAGKEGVAGQLRQAGVHEEFTPLFIAFTPANPKSQEYASLLSATVKDLRASGKLAAILAKYGLKDWE